MTLNINAWMPFRDRWNTEGDFAELENVEVIFIQEHHLTTTELCNDAQEWLERRGWRGIFGRAAKLPSGKPSCGVAILIRLSDAYGITEPGLSSGAFESRLLAVRLAAADLSPCLLVCAYLEVNVGMNETNRTILSTIAQWQEATQLPVVAGADFNLAPRTLANSDFPTRSGLQLVAPDLPTYRTSKSATTIDFFMLASVFAERVTGIQVLKDFPLRPHSPVLCTLEVDKATKTPVLEAPTRLPLQAPFGPALQVRNWSSLAARVREALAYCSAADRSHRSKMQALDGVYYHFVSEMERQVCERTDTPRRMRSRRGRPPRIRWVDPTTRCQEHRASWRTLLRPLQWVQSWIQDVLRYIAGNSVDTSAALLLQDLLDCPAEFREVPSLIGIYQRAQLLIKALAADESTGASCAVLNSEAFRELYSDRRWGQRLPKKGLLSNAAP